uniref:Reverse transcriptase domain-containing protein n=1 Tax=Tanacetum cinerariifolium TaxID=118510 RepID=A0A699GKB0_TANCI|nr:hypothetical protein [Tanacetum cinerariifolium]
MYRLFGSDQIFGAAAGESSDGDDPVFCRPCTCERRRRNYTDKFCSICCFESGSAFIDDLIANSFDDLLNFSDHPPQHQTHSFESYHDNPIYGYPPQEPFVYNQDSCYEQNFVNNSQSPPQPQYETSSCELCVYDAHYGYDCPPQHAQLEDIHELLRKILEDFQIINEELAEYINFPSWNRLAFYYDDDDDEYSIQVSEFLKKSHIAIAPVLPTEDLDNSLSMGDEHLSTIPETESNKEIKSSVEDLVPIPSESEGILDNICYVPFSDKNHFDAKSDLIESLLTRYTSTFYSPKIDYHLEEFVDELVHIDPIPPGINEIDYDPKDDIRFIEQLLYDDTSSEDDSFENIDYVEASPLDSELVSLEEVKDEILREKLLNIHLLIAKIESLNDNSTPDCVLKSPSLSFLFYSDNSLPKFETFSDYTKETSSGGTTTHADNSLPEYDLFLLKIEPDQGELSNVSMEAILGEPRVYVPKSHPLSGLGLFFF